MAADHCGTYYGCSKDSGTKCQLLCKQLGKEAQARQNWYQPLVQPSQMDFIVANSVAIQLYSELHRYIQKGSSVPSYAMHGISCRSNLQSGTSDVSLGAV